MNARITEQEVDLWIIGDEEIVVALYTLDLVGYVVVIDL